MTRLVRAAATAALFALLTPLAAGAQAPALQEGSLMIGGSAFAILEDEDGVEDNVFRLSVFPSVELFVADGLSLGGEVGVSHMSQGDNRYTGLMIGPAATWFFGGRAEGANPFVRGSARWGRSYVSSTFGDSDGDTWSVRGAGGLLFLLNDAVGLNAQLFVERVRSEASVLPDRTVVTGGLALGVWAFLP